jgi:hypothetical protein
MQVDLWKVAPWGAMLVTVGGAYGVLQFQTNQHAAQIEALQATVLNVRQQHSDKVSEILVSLAQAAGERALILDRITRE